jgi:hypothetical protein
MVAFLTKDWATVRAHHRPWFTDADADQRLPSPLRKE